MFQISVYTDEWHTIFGDGETLVSNPVLKQKLNGCGSLEYDIPVSDIYYSDYAQFKTRIKVSENGALLFVGRLLEVSKDFNGSKHMIFEGDMAMLNDVQYPPYEYSGTIAGLFTQVLEYYNSRCTQGNTIQKGRITVTDNNNYIARSNEDYSSCWECLSSKLIDLCGGYMQIRWVVVDDEVYRYLDYLEDPGAISSQSIEFGENIIDITQELEGDDIITVLIPFGAEDETTGERINIKSVNPTGKDYIVSKKYEQYGLIEAVEYWDDVTLPENLYNKAVAYLAEHDSSITTLTVNAIDLHVVDSEVARLNVGDTVNVKSTPHGINTSMLITERSRNLDDPTKDTFTIGKQLKTFTSEVDKNNYGSIDTDGAIASVDILYGNSDSTTEVPTDWSTTAEIISGKYLWQKTKTTYVDGTVAYSTPSCIGGKGNDGKSYYTFIKYGDSLTPETMYDVPGNHEYIGVYTGTSSTAPTSYESYNWAKFVGKDGAKGADGNGINSITYYYMTTTTQTAPEKGSSSWQTTMPEMSSTDKYLWQKEVIDFTDTSVSDQVTVILIAVYGETGKQGEKGNDGTSITIESTEIKYQASTSGTDVPTGEWSTSVPTVENGSYLWTRTIVNYSDGKSTTAYAVAYKGTNGNDGVDIDSIIEEYYLSTSSTEQKGGEWTTESVVWETGKYIWTRSHIYWSDSTDSTTDPVLANGMNSIGEKIMAVEGEIPTDEHIETITEQQTKIMLGGSGGCLQILSDVETNKPFAIRIMDNANEAEAVNVWLFNKDGLGFSNTGINGPFYNAWTIDGHLSADSLYTGVLASRDGSFSLDLDSGTLNVTGIEKQISDTNEAVEKVSTDLQSVSSKTSEIEGNYVSQNDSTYKKITTSVNVGDDGVVIKGSTNGSDNPTSLKINSSGVFIQDKSNNVITSMTTNEFRTGKWVLQQTNDNKSFNLFKER